MSSKKPENRPKAILVGIQTPDVSDEDHLGSLAELGRLVSTLGFQVINTVTQKRRHPVKGTVVGQGKLMELARYTGGTGTVTSRASVKKRRIDEEDSSEEYEEILDEEDSDEDYDDSLNVSEEDMAEHLVFDCELTPNQLRNLEEATGVEVLDRTGVIVEIFHRHAKTREARIQVEIARLRYLAPRLKFSRYGGDRQGGGIGAKGAGESALELDKRRIRDRIAELNRELITVRTSHKERRQRRSEQITVALVGYTNAGKSSLMRALTGSEVLVEDKLFATLDTTIRTLYPESKPKILVSDTVGFIKKLPHDLVASFRSTLDEAGDADLLLFVVDASDPTFRAQLEVTQEVLSEIDANHSPSLLILNKVDNLSQSELSLLQNEFPDGVFLSAHNATDVKKLRETIISHFETGMNDETLHIPYQKSNMLGEIRRTLRVLQESHSEDGTNLLVRGYAEQILRIQGKLSK